MKFVIYDDRAIAQVRGVDMPRLESYNSAMSLRKQLRCVGHAAFTAGRESCRGTACAAGFRGSYRSGTCSAKLPCHLFFAYTESLGTPCTATDSTASGYKFMACSA